MPSSIPDIQAGIAARLDWKWQGNIFPEGVDSNPCEPLVLRAQLCYGGQYIVLLLRDGTLILQGAESDVPYCVENSFKTVMEDIGVTDGMNMSLSLSDSNETLLALTTFYSRDTSFNTVFTVYSVDAHTLSFRLVIPPNKRTHERYEGSPVVKGNRWAFAWWQGSRRLLSVGNIVGQPNQEVTMDIGAFKFQTTISILSDHQILLTCRSGLLLFEIPEFQTGHVRSTVRSRPVWTHTFDSLDDYVYPVISPPELGSGGRIAVLSGFNLRVFQQEESHQDPRVFSYPLQTRDPSRVHARNCISSKRVFFCKDNMLQTCIVPLGSEDDKNQQSSKKGFLQTTSLTIDEVRINGRLRVQDISWDERSGKLCLLSGEPNYGSKLQQSPMRIVVVQY